MLLYNQMVTVIILSYNTRDITYECIKRLERAVAYLKKRDKQDCEIIVIDNASTDGTDEMISQNFPRVTLVTSRHNTGFARGINIGMNKARGEYFLLLNSDSYVFEDTLSEAYQKIVSAPDRDVIGGKLLNPDLTLQPSFGYFPTWGRIFFFLFYLDNLPLLRSFRKAIYIRPPGWYTKIRKVDWISGSFVFLTRDVWTHAGGLDERYAQWGIETEWMHRIHSAGYQVWYVPTIRCIHLGGASSPRSVPHEVKDIVRLFYWIRSLRLRSPFLLYLLVWIGSVFRMIFHPAYSSAYIKGIYKGILFKKFT